MKTGFYGSENDVNEKLNPFLLIFLPSGKLSNIHQPPLGKRWEKKWHKKSRSQRTGFSFSCVTYGGLITKVFPIRYYYIIYFSYTSSQLAVCYISTISGHFNSFPTTFTGNFKSMKIRSWIIFIRACQF